MVRGSSDRAVIGHSFVASGRISRRRDDDEPRELLPLGLALAPVVSENVADEQDRRRRQHKDNRPESEDSPKLDISVPRDGHRSNCSLAKPTGSGASTT